MTLTVQSGQTIFDLAVIAYGDASRIYDLIKENPAIQSPLTNLTGLTITYTPSVLVTKEVVKTTTVSNKNVTIQTTQTLFDLALQYYGSAESVFKLLSDNPAIKSLLDNEYAGKNLNYTLSDAKIPLFFRNNGVQISTKDETTLAEYFYLLQENGFFLLQEDGSKIIIE